MESWEGSAENWLLKVRRLVSGDRVSPDAATDVGALSLDVLESLFEVVGREVLL
jgi:hypothetical protein